MSILLTASWNLLAGGFMGLVVGSFFLIVGLWPGTIRLHGLNWSERPRWVVFVPIGVVFLCYGFRQIFLSLR